MTVNGEVFVNYGGTEVNCRGLKDYSEVAVWCITVRFVFSVV